MKTKQTNLVRPKKKTEKVVDTMALSEKSLGVDWDKSEDEEAWKSFSTSKTKCNLG